MSRWQGSFGITQTPFTRDGRVDMREFERMLDGLCASESSGLIILGSTGEFPFLTEADTREILKRAADAVAGRKLLVGGATSPCAAMTLRQMESMWALGYDGALVAPPYYFAYGDEDVAAFYREIARADVGLPIIAYQISAFTNAMGPETFEALLECPQIAGIKNSDQNIRVLAHQVDVRNRQRPDFAVLSGTEDALLPSLAAGCDGGFTAFGALLPNQMSEIYRAYVAGDLQCAQRAQTALLPLMALCGSLTFPLGYKLLGELLGMRNEYYYQSISPQLRERMRAVKAALADELCNLGLTDLKAAHG